MNAGDFKLVEAIEQNAASERGRRWMYLFVTVVMTESSISRISSGELTKGGWTTANLMVAIFGALIFGGVTLRAWGKNRELELLLKLSTELKQRRSEIGATDSYPATAEPRSVL